MTTTMTKNWASVCHFHPKQVDFWDTIVEPNGPTMILYGGAMAGGKSYALRWCLVRYLHRLFKKYKIKNLRAMLGCETYPALRDRQITKIRSEFPPELGTWQETSKEFTLSEQFGAGVLCLRNLDDPDKYKSSEFAIVGVDELTLQSLDTFNVLVTRIRAPGIPQNECKFIAATNPGGPGHAWVSDLWVKGRYTEGDDPNNYRYIPAVSSDNPSLPVGYADTLNRLPYRLREAYKNGNWDIFEGQVFNEFDKVIHVIEPFDLPSDWRYFRSIDYGYSPGYSAVLWGCEDQISKKVYIYREHYCQERTLQQLADDIVSMTTPAERISYTVADPSIFATNEQTATSNAEVLQRGGVICERADNSRESGWRIVHDFLRVVDEPKGEQWIKSSRLKIFSNCTNLIRTLPTLVHDSGKEDVKKGGEDHLADSLRYMLVSRPALPSVQMASIDALRNKRIDKEFPSRRRDTRQKSAGW